VLRCGHAFCDPCISQWLKTHTNCPICRKDLEDQEEQQPAGQPPASCGAAAGNGVRGQQDVLQQQVRHRGGLVRVQLLCSASQLCTAGSRAQRTSCSSR
jgi:hypothetical protein